jgi:hypothetical protein
MLSSKSSVSAASPVPPAEGAGNNIMSVAWRDSAGGAMAALLDAAATDALEEAAAEEAAPGPRSSNTIEVRRLLARDRDTATAGNAGKE